MKQRDDWFGQMRDEVVGAGVGLTNFNKESRVRGILMGTATGMEEVSFASDTAYQNLYLATAKGEAFWVRMRELGRERKPAQKATGWFTFIGIAGAVVPVGTRVATGDPDTDDNVVEYLTTAEVTVPVGETSSAAPIEAVAEGPAYNVDAGVIDTVVDTVPDITGGSNLTAVAGGTLIETEEDGRRRGALSPYRTALGQPPRFWESLATDIVGVARARCISCWAGENTFKVLVWSRDAVGDLVPASETLADAVDALLQEYVLPGVVLSVAPAEGPAQDVVVYLEATGNWEAASEAAGTAIRDLFPTELLVIAEVVAAVMGVTNVTDCRVASPKENVAAAKGMVYAGVVRVLPMEWDGDYAL